LRVPMSSAVMRETYFFEWTSTHMTSDCSEAHRFIADLPPEFDAHGDLDAAMTLFGSGSHTDREDDEPR